MGAKHPTRDQILARASRVELLALDVDGVLTDGKLYFSASGEEAKAFNTLDGHGLRLLQDHGARVALISGRRSQAVEMRAAELGIELLYQGRTDKLAALNDILAQQSLDYAGVAFIGDDLPDLACIRKAGLGVAVANAHELVKQHAFCTTTLKGGEGAVREVCDWLLQARGNYEAVVSQYL